MITVAAEADSPQVVSVLDEVKRIKVTAPKPGRLYPNLSDIEATTTDQDTRTPTPNEENRCDKITNWILFCLCLAWFRGAFFV